MIKDFDRICKGDVILVLTEIQHGIAELRYSRDLFGGVIENPNKGFQKKVTHMPLPEGLQTAFNFAQSIELVQLGIRRNYEQGTGGLLLYSDRGNGQHFNWFTVEELLKQCENMKGKALGVYIHIFAEMAKRSSKDTELPVMIKGVNGADMLFMVRKSEMINSPVLIKGETFA